MNVPSSGSISFAGQLLIAMPAMTDARFAHAVIFICAHGEEGALGIVVNHPLATPNFAELLTQLKIEPYPPLRSLRVQAGGPVESGRGFVLHSADWLGEGTLRVGESLALTASLEILQVVAAGGGPRMATLALGYAGWGPGQLDAEMRGNTWLTGPADEGILFDTEDGTKWHRALRRLGIDPVLLSSEVGRA